MIVAPFATASEGIAAEARMLRRAAPAALLWQSETPALVVPEAFARKPGFADAASAAGGHGWPVTTRSSGGGIVPQGRHTVNLAIVLPCPAGFSPEAGYRLICGAISEALTRFEVETTTGWCNEAFCDGAWNVLADGRKLAGTAQRWRATADGPVALIHAAVLTTPPSDTLWPAIKALHGVSQPDSPPPRPEAHVALTTLMPDTMKLASFPGALARSVEDRLANLVPGEHLAA